MKTADEIYELVLRIQAEDEHNAATLLFKALRESYFDGWNESEKIQDDAFKNSIGATLSESIDKYLNEKRTSKPE